MPLPPAGLPPAYKRPSPAEANKMRSKAVKALDAHAKAGERRDIVSHLVALHGRERLHETIIHGGGTVGAS